MSFRKRLISCFEQYAALPCVADDQASYCYQDIYQQIKSKGEQLPSRPSLVVVRCQSNLVSLVNYLACLLGGHVPLLVEANDDETSDFIIRQFDPNVVLTDNDCHLRHDRQIKMADELALLLPTSGSEGKIKVVRLSQRNLLSNAESIIQALPIKQNDVAAIPLPLAYCYALSVVHTHLLQGACVYISQHSLMTSEFWQRFQALQPTSLCGVPFIYQMLQRLGLQRLPLGSIRYFTQAGGRLAPGDLKQWIDFCDKTNQQFYVMYGQTEATARMSIMPFEHLLDNPSSVGTAVAGGSFRLAEDGEVIYAGDNVMMGYALNQQDLAKSGQLKALHTGDLGVLNGAYLTLKGRKKRFMKYQGKRISLDHIESQLAQIAPVAAIQMQDSLVLFSEEGLDVAKIGRAIAVHPAHIHIQQVAQLPRKANGKIDYQSLEKLNG